MFQQLPDFHQAMMLVFEAFVISALEIVQLRSANESVFELGLRDALLAALEIHQQMFVGGEVLFVQADGGGVFAQQIGILAKRMLEMREQFDDTIDFCLPQGEVVAP